MNEKKPTKFYNKCETTYYDLFKLRFETIIDLANAFGEKIETKEIYDLIGKLSEEKSIENVRQVIEKNPIRNFNDFKILFKSQMKSELFINSTTYKIVEETDNKLKFKITECLWAKGFKDLNEPELGYCASCHADFVIAKTYHPKIKLTRTKTLMQGDDYCNHTYTWKKKNES